MNTVLNVKTPKYFRIQRLVLKYGGISVEGFESCSYKIYSAFVLVVLVASFPVFLFINLIIQGKFNEVIVSWAFAIPLTVDSWIAIYTYYKRKELGRLLNNLEGELFLPDPKRCAIKEEEELLKEWSFYYRSHAILFLTGATITMLTPIIITFKKRVMSSDYQDWKLAWGTVTIVNVTYSPNFEFVWLYQNLGIVYICVNVVPLFLIMFSSLSFVSVQFKILHSYLRRLVDVSGESTVKDNNKPMILTNIEYAISYHLHITNIAKEIENFFGGPLLLIFMAILGLLCLEVYRASFVSINDFRLLIIFVESVTSFFTVLIICYYGEEVAHNSEEVGNIAFQMDFVGRDKRFQESLIFIIRRSQKVIRMKAGGLIEISMATTVWILRAAFSAYMMLRTVNSPDK